eukprot:9003753-Prorocentrum_lima.AAC.1
MNTEGPSDSAHQTSSPSLIQEAASSAPHQTPSSTQEVSGGVMHQGTSSRAVRRPQFMTLAKESALGITLTNPS